MGLIFQQGENMEDYFLPEILEVGNDCLIPGENTTMSGFFNVPVKYVGILKDEQSKFMCFYLGEDDRQHYYEVVVYINSLRIFKKYTDLSGRDYIFKNNKWK